MDRIVENNVVKEVQDSFLRYSMSVIPLVLYLI